MYFSLFVEKLCEKDPENICLFIILVEEANLSFQKMLFSVN